MAGRKDFVLRGAGVLVVAGVLAGGGAYVVNSGGAETANLWVDTNGGTCTRQASAATYVDAAACSSLNTAYAAASAGDTVLVKGGSYSAVQINESTSGGKEVATRVTIREAANESASIASINFGNGQLGNHGPAFLTLDGVTVTGDIVMWGFTNDVTIQNLQGIKVQGYGAQNIIIDNSDFGPCSAPAQSADCASKIDADANYAPTQQSSGWTISDSVFHDTESTNLATIHAECFFIRGGSNITFERNWFYNCHIYDIFIQASSESNPTNVTIQNNWFDAPFNDQARTVRAARAVTFGDCSATLADYLIRFNSFYESEVEENDCSPGSTNLSNVRVLGNILKSCNTQTGLTQEYNIYNSATGCGTNKQTSVSWPYTSAASGSSGNYHLSASNNYVTPTTSDYALTTDKDGDARTAGSRDAGADEG